MCCYICISIGLQVSIYKRLWLACNKSKRSKRAIEFRFAKRIMILVEVERLYDCSGGQIAEDVHVLTVDRFGEISHQRVSKLESSNFIGVVTYRFSSYHLPLRPISLDVPNHE